MNRKTLIAVLCLAFLVSTILPLYARPTMHRRGKNLHRLVDHKTLKIYLGDIESNSNKISKELFKKTIKDFLAARNKENFVITDTKDTAQVIINATLLDFKYLEKDPVDHLAGGWTGLLIDAAVDQNYARIDAEFEVIRVKDGRKLWNRKYYSTVTEGDMPEEESIPKVLNTCCKQFVFLCFSKSKR